jgi:hypothetical protein
MSERTKVSHRNKNGTVTFFNKKVKCDDCGKLKEMAFECIDCDAEYCEECGKDMMECIMCSDIRENIRRKKAMK